MSNGESRESLDLLASAAEQSSPQSRIKRNTACVSCRDSKVREIARVARPRVLLDVGVACSYSFPLSPTTTLTMPTGEMQREHGPWSALPALPEA